MTDNQLRSLLEDYAKPLQFRPEIPLRRHWPKRIATFGAVGLTASVLAVSLLTPRPATVPTEGAPLSTTIADARTMFVEEFIVDAKTGKEDLFFRQWYSEGQWRLHVRPNKFRERVLIFRDGSVYSYLPKKRVVTLHPVLTENEYAFRGRTAVDYAMSAVDFGDTGEIRSLEKKAGPGETDLLVLSRPNYRSEIQVDRRTGLPIQAKTEVTYVGELGSQTTLLRFRFNESIPAKEFDPKSFASPIVDMLNEQAKYRSRWETPLASARGVDIRDAAVAADGTVFVTFSTEPRGPMPDTLRDERGTHYLRVQDMTLGNYQGSNSLGVSAPYLGTGLHTTVWTPVEPVAGAPGEIHVGITRRSLNAIPSPTNKPAIQAELSVTPRRLAGEFLEYGTAFDLSSSEDVFSQQIAAARANYYKKTGNSAAEIRWRLTQARQTFNTLRTSSRSLATDIVRRLKELGRVSEAKKVEREFGLDPAKRGPGPVPQK
ncbi:MAG: hypothetical protein ACO1SV_12530 [Fimbriimonas sp.]